MKSIQAEKVSCGCYRLPKNDVWNPPRNAVSLELDHYCGAHSVVKSVRGLVVEYETGVVWGMRKVHHPKQDGSTTIGRVSVGGQKRRCFIGHVMFEHDDGHLTRVACLFI